MKFLLHITLIVVIQGCSSTSINEGAALAADFCPEYGEYFNIQRHENRALTICPIDSPPDCHNDFYLQAYEHQKVDLNNDGLKDYIAVIKSGLVGIDHDLSYYAVYFACDHGRYRRVLFDAFTTIEPNKYTFKNTRSLSATRSCYNSTSGDFSTNKYLIEYNGEAASYGSPDNDKKLLDFCGPYELSLPNSKQTK